MYKESVPLHSVSEGNMKVHALSDSDFCAARFFCGMEVEERYEAEQDRYKTG